MSQTNIKIGVLALQGAFIEHISSMKTLSKKLAIELTPVEVRYVGDMQGIHGLIIPGGESTSMSLIGSKDNLLEEITTWVRKGNPVWGTCAGCIMLAKDVQGQKLGGQGLIGSMDISVHRNYFGRQRSSFEIDLDINFPDLTCSSGGAFPGIFIRAPAILSVVKNEANPVVVMAEMEVPDNISQLTTSGGLSASDFLVCSENFNTSSSNNISNSNNHTNADGEKVIVAARQGFMLASVFHPELTDDTRFHEYFVHLVKKHMEASS